MDDLKKYVKKTREYPGCNEIDFKWADGTGDDFPRLSIKVRNELVTFGVPDEIKVEGETYLVIKEADIMLIIE